MKREHDLQEGGKRKVLRLEEGQEGDSSGSDAEDTGRDKKDKDKSGQNIDIQVSPPREENTVQQCLVKATRTQLHS